MDRGAGRLNMRTIASSSSLGLNCEPLIRIQGDRPGKNMRVVVGDPDYSVFGRPRCPNQEGGIKSCSGIHIDSEFRRSTGDCPFFSIGVRSPAHMCAETI